MEFKGTSDVVSLVNEGKNTTNKNRGTGYDSPFPIWPLKEERFKKGGRAKEEDSEEQLSIAGKICLLAGLKKVKVAGRAGKAAKKTWGHMSRPRIVQTKSSQKKKIFINGKMGADTADKHRKPCSIVWTLRGGEVQHSFKQKNNSAIAKSPWGGW